MNISETNSSDLFRRLSYRLVFSLCSQENCQEAAHLPCTIHSFTFFSFFLIFLLSLSLSFYRERVWVEFAPSVKMYHVNKNGRFNSKTRAFFNSLYRFILTNLFCCSSSHVVKEKFHKSHSKPVRRVLKRATSAISSSRLIIARSSKNLHTFIRSNGNVTSLQFFYLSFTRKLKKKAAFWFASCTSIG